MLDRLRAYDITSQVIAVQAIEKYSMTEVVEAFKLLEITKKLGETREAVGEALGQLGRLVAGR